MAPVKQSYLRSITDPFIADIEAATRARDHALTDVTCRW